MIWVQYNYIPKDISKEWIDGMIDFIPLTNQAGLILNQDRAIKYLCENKAKLLENYPRIQQSFEISGTYDFELIYSNNPAKRLLRVGERKKLIKEILLNVQQFNLYD